MDKLEKGKTYMVAFPGEGQEIGDNFRNQMAKIGIKITVIINSPVITSMQIWEIEE